MMRRVVIRDIDGNDCIGGLDAGIDTPPDSFRDEEGVLYRLIKVTGRYVHFEAQQPLQPSQLPESWQPFIGGPDAVETPQS